MADIDEAKLPLKCGYVAIVGRPNVGKSTLLNHLLGQKISITSRKPQTTRYNTLGIKTDATHQIIFVDTPGLHTKQTKTMNRLMNKAAECAIQDVDVVVFVVDRHLWTDADDKVANEIAKSTAAVIVAVNKTDRIDESDNVVSVLHSLSTRFPDAHILPISALHGHHLLELTSSIKSHLPDAPHFFPDDQITDRSVRFLASEIVREKITRQLGDELPYEATVEIEEFTVKGAVTHISALILVERDGQKKIIIGDKGSRLKKIGQQARLDIEKLIESKVMLNLWVKVKRGWSDDERALRSLGFDE